MNNEKIKFTFTDAVPRHLDVAATILISGDELFSATERKYLVATRDEGIEHVYEIRYQYDSGSFRDAMITDDILVVGFGEYFYLFDLAANVNLIRLKMYWYFGYLYHNNKLFFVADARGIHCINTKGSIVWQNDQLGIDGVIIKEFTANRIFGIGEWDPPGGWLEFIIDKLTGTVVKSPQSYY